MRDLPSLLIHPHPFRTEGPRGYLLRLASENQLPTPDLHGRGIIYDLQVLKAHGLMPQEELDPGLHRHVQRMSSLMANHKSSWNHQNARFCPLCLAEDPYWRAGWELYFHDACPVHGVWMIDKCSSCWEPLVWNRPDLVRCRCGADLRTESARECPDNVIWLAKILTSKLLEAPADFELGPFAELSVPQSQQLIRYIGVSMPMGDGSLKIRKAGTMDVSWHFTSVAATLLANWPVKYHGMLDFLQSKAGEAGGHSLKTAFGRTYHYLYVGLKGSAFDPIRQAFGEWAEQHWRGGLAGRNKRITDNMLRDARWIPAKVARNILGISHPRLIRLVREGVMDGEEFISSTGRKYLMVRGDQVDVARQRLNAGLDLRSAGALLGFTKKRMRSILEFLFPEATKSVGAESLRWSIPRAEVEAVLELADTLPVIGIPDEGCVTINHILRYWAWVNREIADLIRAAQRGDLMPLARVDGERGVSGLVFEEKALKLWRDRNARGLGEWLSCPQFAKAFSISQQAAYELVDNDFIESERVPHLRAGGWRIRRRKAEQFFREYVFGSTLAGKLGTTSRRVRTLLEERSILPVSGPGIDGAKKILYQLTPAIEAFVAEYTGRGQEEFALTGLGPPAEDVGKSRPDWTSGNGRLDFG